MCWTTYSFSPFSQQCLWENEVWICVCQRNMPLKIKHLLVLLTISTTATLWHIPILWPENTLMWEMSLRVLVKKGSRIGDTVLLVWEPATIWATWNRHMKFEKHHAQPLGPDYLNPSPRYSIRTPKRRLHAHARHSQPRCLLTRTSMSSLSAVNLQLIYVCAEQRGLIP